MSDNEMVSRVENDRVLVLERVFNAPRDLVFRMFKEPEHLKRWWEPRGWRQDKTGQPFRICIGECFEVRYGHGRAARHHRNLGSPERTAGIHQVNP